MFHKLCKGSAVTGLAAMLTMMPLGGAVAEADALEILGGIYGASQAYEMYLDQYLAMGNSPKNQQEHLVTALKHHGADANQQDRQLVDGVMEQLLGKGQYVLRARSLPFRWAIVNDDTFNASCAAMDSVAINRGLLTGLHGDRDELAGVLGHEMTHGLHQHVAHELARQAAEEFGMSLINMGKDGNQQLFNIFRNYYDAKNISLPAEYDADENGFYVMASAGFNPGGMAAMMSKMQEYTRNSADFADFFNPSDHPDTDKRLTKAAKQLEEYGYHHVTVQNGKDVYLDHTLLLSTQPTNDYTAEEMAYLIAGGLDKGFHDNRLASSWWFTKQPDGTTNFLTDDRAYQMMKAAIHQNKLENQLEALVTAAYANDSRTGNRDHIYALEKKRLDDLKTEATDKTKVDEYTQTEMNSAADAYMDLGVPRLAITEINRVFAANQENTYSYEIRGHAYTLLKQPEKGIADLNVAIQQDPEYGWAFARRAEAYLALNNKELALQDAEKAIRYRPKISQSYIVKGKILDSEGNTSEALEAYRRAKGADPKVVIPARYQQLLDQGD